MKYFPLIWAGLTRRKARTVLTLLAVIAAFTLFGLLQGVNAGFARAVNLSRLDRLMIQPRSQSFPLPYAYVEQVEHLPGVTMVAYANNVGGYVQDPKQGMGINGVTERFFQDRTELSITPAEAKLLWDDPTAVVMGMGTQKRMNLKVGDTFTLHTTTLKEDGSLDWTFHIVGTVHDTNYGDDSGWTVGNYGYIDAERKEGKGTLGIMAAMIGDPDQSVQISAVIDKLFANSGAPTRTQSERTGAEQGLASLGDVGFFINAVMVAVAFMLLFLTATAMMQSVRERTSEIAVLKTLGFSDSGVLALIFSESLLLACAGAALGFVAAKASVTAIKGTIPFIGGLMGVPWSIALETIPAALLIAALGGLLPAIRAKNLSIIDALSVK